MTPYRSAFNFVKTVAELSDFTVEKEFKAVRNILWKYDVVFFDFIFGQTAFVYIYIYIYYTYIAIYIHTHIHINIHIHTYTNIHTYAHIHIHIYIHTSRKYKGNIKEVLKC